MSPLNSLDFARANFEVASRAPTAEWTVTIYFYAALHAVNYARFGLGPVPDSYRHGQRRMWVGANLGSVSADYEFLEQLSWAARYTPSAHPLPLGTVDKAEKLALAILTAAGCMNS